ncbi:MAG: CoA pyrophosphatase [Porticoccaceae bacterium]
MLKQITESLKSTPVDRLAPFGEEGVDAAILIPLTLEWDDPKIILTKRAEHLNSHSGEVAFPGGKWESEDEDLLVTALRETWEEIDLAPEQVSVIAGLPVNRTRHLLRVKPYVGLIEPQLPLVPNPEELDAVFEVPVRYFLDPANLTVDHFSGEDYSLDMPCYIFEGFRIWGFTLVVLVDFLNRTLDAGIRLHYPDRISLRPPA